jgi:hypothetical protein
LHVEIAFHLYFEGKKIFSDSGTRIEIHSRCRIDYEWIRNMDGGSNGREIRNLLGAFKSAWISWRYAKDIV